MTVTTVLLTVMSSARASSPVPWNASRSTRESGSCDTCDITKPAASANNAAAVGSTHSAPLTYSLKRCQATDRRTRRASPAEWEVDAMREAIPRCQGLALLTCR